MRDSLISYYLTQFKTMLIDIWNDDHEDPYPLFDRLKRFEEFVVKIDQRIYASYGIGMGLEEMLQYRHMK